MKRGNYCLLSVVALSFLLVPGCNSVIKNTTPTQMPQNSSEIYPISMTIGPKLTGMSPISYSAQVVIDGEVHKMDLVGSSKKSFVFNYKRPTGRHKARYYYEVDYREGPDKVKKQKSPLYDLSIVNRYIIGFESNRGLPGSSAVLLGRGFVDGDYIEIGGVACDTTVLSSNSISFAVPALSSGGLHRTRLVSNNGDFDLGSFNVDFGTMHADPSNLNLSCRDKQMLTVHIDFDAPPGGLLIDVTTNVPRCVVMDDICIPAGARSASVPVRGAATGSGMIYLTAKGFEELKIPVGVVPSRSYYDNLDEAPDDEFFEEDDIPAVSEYSPNFEK